MKSYGGARKKHTQKMKEKDATFLHFNLSYMSHSSSAHTFTFLLAFHFVGNEKILL